MCFLKRPIVLYDSLLSNSTASKQFYFSFRQLRDNRFRTLFRTRQFEVQEAYFRQTIALIISLQQLRYLYIFLSLTNTKRGTKTLKSTQLCECPSHSQVENNSVLDESYEKIQTENLKNCMISGLK